jgi:hypothetical protein
LYKDNIKPRVKRAADTKSLHVNGVRTNGTRLAARPATKGATVSVKP